MPSALVKRLEQGFEWHEERLVYKGARHILPGETKTGYEFFGSKTYITDFIEDKSSDLSLESLVHQGFSYASLLANSLFQHSSNFSVYIFGHLKDDFSECNDCCVQFHLNRPLEIPPIKFDDIHAPDFSNPTAILNFVR